MSTHKGFIHLYFGKGKGKTTAALGLLMRAVGAGFSVEMIQFMKTNESSEIQTINMLDHVRITTFGNKGFLKKNEYDAIDKRLAQEGLEYAKQIIMDKHCDVLILDEITLAADFGLLDKKDVITLLKQKPESMTIVLTGRIVDQAFIHLSDVVTEMKEIKHPFQQGLSPQKGIDF